jgi:hypothetical protein
MSNVLDTTRIRSYYAAEKGIDEAPAIEHGLREKAQELQRVGADTCGKV